jgi:hypothetical protein
MMNILKTSTTITIFIFSALSAQAMTLMTPNTDQHKEVVIDNKNPLVLAFQSCVSPVGLTRDLPEVAAMPTMEKDGQLFQLNDTGKIRDGYRHQLYVSADKKTIYIIQIGGIAGTSKAFGPFDSTFSCAASTDKK